MSEPDVSGLISVDEAIAIIDAVRVSPRSVAVNLEDADGLVLAEDVKADRDYPPFDKSLMDGFAVKAGDGLELRVVGEIAAGQEAGRAVGAGEAMAIMTGAPVPAGADAVVPVEDVERAGEVVRIKRSVGAGKNIARRGSEVRAGDVVLQRGMRLGPAQIAVAASVGASRVRVFAKPQAAVLGTGDELVGVDQTPGPAQIRNSNNIMLVSLLKRMGCDVTDLGVVRDDPSIIRAAIERGLKFDALFVTGGMSMGAHDHVPRILRELGVELLITKVKIKPGKPFVFGVKEKSFVFGLPGNPVSGFVCTVRLASRLIARLGGGDIDERWIEGRLSDALPENGPREFYQPVNVRDGNVQVLQWKGSADVFTLAQANGLVLRKPNEAKLQAGMAVRVLSF